MDDTAAQGGTIGYLVDWPDEPELGYYFCENPTKVGRCRALVLADAQPEECRSPYCECPAGQCTHGRVDKRGERVADAETKAVYVAMHGTDRGWLGIEGSYFISGYTAARSIARPDAAYTAKLIDRLLMPPPAMTASGLTSLHNEAAKMLHLLSHAPAQPSAEPWRNAVEQMLATTEQSASDDPRESLDRLISWHVSVALDPLVSSDARTLVQMGRDEVAAQPSAEPSELVRAARDAVAWMDDPQMSTWRYLEGPDLHDDIAEHSDALRRALDAIKGE